MTRHVPLAALLVLTLAAAPFARADDVKKPVQPTFPQAADAKQPAKQPSYPKTVEAKPATPGRVTVSAYPAEGKDPYRSSQGANKSSQTRVVTIQPDFPVAGTFAKATGSGAAMPQPAAATSPETQMDMQDNEMEFASDNTCELGLLSENELLSDNKLLSENELLSDNSLLSDNTDNQVASENRMMSDNRLLADNEGGVQLASENEATLLSHNKASFLSGIRLLSGISIQLDISVTKAAEPLAKKGKAKARRKRAKEAREKAQPSRPGQTRPSSARPAPSTGQRPAPNTGQRPGNRAPAGQPQRPASRSAR